MMEDNISDFVFIDGVHLRKDVLVTMAKNAGNITIAEHYMNHLLTHAILYKRDNIFKEVGEIRERYQLMPIPNPKPAPGSDKYQPNFKPLFESPADKARKVYKRMTLDEKRTVLRTALILLRIENELLFPKKVCWIGIYLVVKDRLDDSLKPKDFYDHLASKCMPADWPKDLEIYESTLRGFSRYINAKDSKLAYYEMDDNPFIDLCNEFWNILLDQIINFIPEKGRF